MTKKGINHGSATVGSTTTCNAKIQYPKVIYMTVKQIRCNEEVPKFEV